MKNLEILNADMNPLFYAKRKMLTLIFGLRIPSALPEDGSAGWAVNFELLGLEGLFLGEITQQWRIMSSDKQFRIYDSKGELKGKAFEKLVIPGPYLELMDSKKKAIARIKGYSKSFGKEPRIYVTTPDDKEIIATCTAIDKESYRMEVLIPEMDPFLILSLVILYLVKSRIW